MNANRKRSSFLGPLGNDVQTVAQIAFAAEVPLDLAAGSLGNRQGFDEDDAPNGDVVVGGDSAANGGQGIVVVLPAGLALDLGNDDQFFVAVTLSRQCPHPTQPHPPPP